MPDISMCNNKQCKFKEECYRFTATPDKIWQTYGVFDFKDKTSMDTFFWKNGKPSVNPKNKEDE
jgi:hypothetical protein